MQSCHQNPYLGRSSSENQTLEAAINNLTLQWCKQARTSINVSHLSHPHSWLKWKARILNLLSTQTTKSNRLKVSSTCTTSSKNNKTWPNFNKFNFRISMQTNLNLKSYSTTWKTVIRSHKATFKQWASLVNPKKNKWDKLGAKWNLKSWQNNYLYHSATLIPNLSPKKLSNNFKRWSSRRSKQTTFTLTGSKQLWLRKSSTKCKTCLTQLV